MVRRFALTFLVRALTVLLLVAGVSAGEPPADVPAAPAPPAPPPLDASTRDIDQLDLAIRVHPDLEAGTVAGEVDVSFAALRDGVRQLRLHALDMEIASVEDVEANALPFQLTDGVLSIELPEPLAAEATSRVTVKYVARPTQGLFFHKPCPQDPARPLLLYSQGQGNENRRWIPCYDLPDDRFRWTLEVRIPNGLTSVSNGEKRRPLEHEDGTHTDRWAFRDRAPSYLISLVVGQFETVTSNWNGVVLEFNGPPGRRDELTTSLALTSKMMDVFTTWLDEPYPWTRYAQTYVWDFVYGGMENVTTTTLNMRALHTEKVRPNYRSDGLIAHELAHMWFGDLLTCRTWEHIWLNEGFATYMTDVFFEHHDGAEELQLQRRRQNGGYMAETPTPETLGLERDPRGDRPVELSGGKAYSRGSGILHTLRREIGDEAFREGIRAYVDRHHDGTVVSEDLRTALEEAAGRDLEWFFDQWVYGVGYPRFRVTRDEQRGVLVVEQEQPEAGGQGLFRMTVPVRWGPDGEVTPLRLYARRHTFPLPKDAGPYLRFGVGGDLLLKATVDQGPEAWTAMLLSDPDVTARLDAAEALEPYGEVVVAALAKAMADDASASVRASIAEILGRLQGRAAGTVLVAAAEDRDPRVREAVAEALGAYPRALAGEALLARVIDEGEHPYVRAAAAHALGRVKAEGARDLLEGLLHVDSHVDIVRTGTIRGLEALGDPHALPLVLPYLDYCWGRGAHHKLRQVALDCVLRLAPDDPRVKAAVAALLTDPYHRMRQWAAEACGRFRVDAAAPALEALAKDDWNGSVRSAAKKALEAIKPAAK
ncbi:MAG: M1 family aminopeptidase [Planctomycetota bacterium]